jgi:hypothetical protein
MITDMSFPTHIARKRERPEHKTLSEHGMRFRSQSKSKHYLWVMKKLFSKLSMKLNSTN